MKRRDAMVALAGAIALPASAQLLQPFALRLVRRTGWPQLMFKNQCVIGDLYMTTSVFPISDPGTKLANALELTYRNNLKDISSIPEGEYPGSVRTDGPRGWRIELQGTGDRKNIQVHIGNRPDNTIVSDAYSPYRPRPARRASPKLPHAQTDLIRVLRLRSSRSWPPGPGHELPLTKGGVRNVESGCRK